MTRCQDITFSAATAQVISLITGLGVPICPHASARVLSRSSGFP